MDLSKLTNLRSDNPRIAAQRVESAENYTNPAYPDIEAIHRRSELQRKFVAEAESFLATNLPRDPRTWPSQCNPTKSTPSQSSPCNGKQSARHVVKRIYLVTLVVVGVDPVGLIDESAALDLLRILTAVADDCQCGEILIYLSRVASITAQLVNIIASVRDRCQFQGRRVLLCGGGLQHALWRRNAGRSFAWFLSPAQAIRHLLLYLV
jgi:hypothetical protein